MSLLELLSEARLPEGLESSRSLIYGLGFGELVLIFLIVLVIFGAAKLPQLGRGLGEGISNFRQGLKKDEKRPTPADDRNKE